MEVFNDVYGSGGNLTIPNGTCLFSYFPCSITITGNLILVGFYGLLLACAAKLISDGAELLLDFGLPASIIGGVVLPLLGAIPDSAMIIFSGIGGNKTEANNELTVGMGTLAGSTIMLLTLPWLGSLLLGRVDIVNGVGVDETTSKFTLKSFLNQGVSVFPDVTYSAIIMLITTLPYFIVQGADWHYGPRKKSMSTFATTTLEKQPSYIKYSALTTSILAFIFLIAYLIFQVVYSVSSKRKEDSRKESQKIERLKRKVIKGFYVTSLKGTSKSVQSSNDENSPLLSKTETKAFARVWRNHRAAKLEENKPDVETSGSETSTVPESKLKIFFKSSFYLIVGVAFVTIFSNPMVDALTFLTSTENKVFTDGSKHGQYIPIPVFYVSFIVTPICSNASEIVSSLIFAYKRRKESTSMTYSQLYGAATMNNTLCLSVFSSLVFFNGLYWQFSAEVTVILFLEYAVGIMAIGVGFLMKHTYRIYMGFIVGCLYFFSIFFIFSLEKFAKWK